MLVYHMFAYLIGRRDWKRQNLQNRVLSSVTWRERDFNEIETCYKAQLFLYKAKSTFRKKVYEHGHRMLFPPIQLLPVPTTEHGVQSPENWVNLIP